MTEIGGFLRENDVTQRVPLALDCFLENLWVAQTGSSGDFVVRPSFFKFEEKEFSAYQYKKAEILLALECLNQAGKLQNASLIVDENGRLKRDLTDDVWRHFIGSVPLRGVSVGVVGGAGSEDFQRLRGNGSGF